MMKKLLLIAAFALSSIPMLAQNDVGIGTTNPQARLDVMGNGISYDLMNVSNDKQSPVDSIFVISRRGHAGLGVTVPLERLTLGPADGAIILGPHVRAAGSEVAGTIEWDGTNFRGFDGTSWLNMDVQSDWQVINPSFYNTASLYVTVPGFTAVGLPGTTPSIAIPANEFANLYVSNSHNPPTFGHQLLLEDFSGNYNASQHFMITNRQGGGTNLSFSMGIFNTDGTFKLTNSGVLTATSQGDASTMLRAGTSGIIDLPNQSRVRAYHEDPSGMNFQLILPGVWTPINFTVKAPAPYGYDEQAEFTTSPAVNIPGPPENAFFVATVAGYYQVNARCEFNVYNYEEDDQYPGWPGGPVGVASNSYVAIAVYSGPAVGLTTPYAIGNHLQIGYLYLGLLGVEVVDKLTNNNAPNVSDVVYLQAGEIISIWAFHTATTPMNLLQGKTRCYVSIHKVS